MKGEMDEGRGKRTAWEAEITRAFQQIMNKPFSQITEDSEQFKLLEHFTVLMYDKANNLDSVNECRRTLFCQKGKSMENIPPTQAALLQHSRCAIRYIKLRFEPQLTKHKSTCPPQRPGDGQSTVEPGNPTELPFNMLQKHCRELIQCGCKTKAGCIAVAAKCSCLKNGPGWTCTELCSCYCKKWMTSWRYRWNVMWMMTSKLFMSQVILRKARIISMLYACIYFHWHAEWYFWMFLYGTLKFWMTLFTCVCRLWITLWIGLMFWCFYMKLWMTRFFLFFLVASFDRLRPLLVASHCSFCSVFIGK